MTDDTLAAQLTRNTTECLKNHYIQNSSSDDSAFVSADALNLLVQASELGFNENASNYVVLFFLFVLFLLFFELSL